MNNAVRRETRRNAPATRWFNRSCLVAAVFSASFWPDGRLWASDAKNGKDDFTAIEEIVERGEYGRALLELDAMIRCNPAYAQRAYELRGRCKFHRGWYVEALADFDMAVAQGSTRPLVDYQRGMALTYLRRYADAVAALTRAIELEPDNAEYYYRRGYAALKADNLPQAVLDLGRAERLGFDEPYLFLYRAMALKEQGEFAAARRDIAALLERDPGSSNAVTLLETIEWLEDKQSKARDPELDEVSSDEVDPAWRWNSYPKTQASTKPLGGPRPSTEAVELWSRPFESLVRPLEELEATLPTIWPGDPLRGSSSTDQVDQPKIGLDLRD